MAIDANLIYFLRLLELFCHNDTTIFITNYSLTINNPFVDKTITLKTQNTSQSWAGLRNGTMKTGTITNIFWHKKTASTLKEVVETLVNSLSIDISGLNSVNKGYLFN